MALAAVATAALRRPSSSPSVFLAARARSLLSACGAGPSACTHALRLPLPAAAPLLLSSAFLRSPARFQSGGKNKNRGGGGGAGKGGNSAANTKGVARARNDGPASSNSSSSTSGGARAGGAAAGSGSQSQSSSSSSSSSSAATTGSRTHAGGGVEGDIVMTVRDLTKILPGGRVLFKDMTLAFLRGAKIGVLGLNGAGKSSLLKILGGVDTEFDGSVWKAEGLKVGYLPQEPTLDPSKNVHDNVMDGLKDVTDLLARYESLSHKMADGGGGTTKMSDDELAALLEEQAAVQAEIERKDAWNMSHIVAIAKEALRVPPDDADVTKLSGGERRRVALCRLLLEKPDLLLLDEPTNHLDATSVAWLERFLREYKGAVLAITHDRYFLDNVAGWILEIDRGQAYPYQGNYSVWLERKSARLDQEKRAEKKRAKMMEEELEWIRAGVNGRQSKSKARISRFEEMQKGVEDERAKEKFLSGQIVIPPPPRLGNQVLDVEGVSKTFEDGRVLFKDVSFSIPPGAIVGVIGANGVGKTTLLRIVTGEIPPDSGRIAMGKTVVPSLVSQSRAELEGDQRVLDVVCGGVDTIPFGSFEMPSRQYLAAFNLVGETQTKLVRSLSGGERNRVHLARALRQCANLLLLDEPTNDLDVDTLRSLEEALLDFPGVPVIVSHDRYFLDRVCTHMLVFHGDGRVEWFEGGYAEYERYAAKLASSEEGKRKGGKIYLLPTGE